MSRGVEIGVEVGVESKTSRDEAIEEVSRNKKSYSSKELDQSTSCRESIERSRGFSIDPEAIEELSRGQEVSQLMQKLSRSCQDCDKMQLKISTDEPGIERCREGIEKA